jgi:8-oxo-dGTP diphosphatase
LATLQDQVVRGALPLHLLPGKFTLTDLQRACEAILGRELDKGAFRRRIADHPMLVPVFGEFLGGPQQPE